MATYKEIFGKQIKFLSSDPTNEGEGQIWYNSTSGTFKSVLISEGVSSGANLGTGRAGCAGGGIQTAAWASGGSVTGPPNTALTITEEYNGNGWSAGGAMGTARMNAGSAGPQTAGIAAGGMPNPYPPVSMTTVESYNGTTWSGETALPTAVYHNGFIGSEPAGVSVGTETPSAINAVFNYDGSTWTTGGTRNNIRGYTSATGTQTAGISAGGYNPPVTSAGTKVESYDGSTWTNETDCTQPSYSNSFSGSQTSAVKMGGQTDTPPVVTNAVETYDGSTWTTSPATLASARGYVGSAANAPSSSAGLVAGGSTTAAVSGSTAATEEFNRSANVVTAGAWASGGALNTGRYSLGGFGIQTAAVGFAGRATPIYNATEEYDGNSWTTVNTYPHTLVDPGSTGTLTAGLGLGGYAPPGSPPFPTTGPSTNEYNGTNWTAGGAYPYNAWGAECAGTQSATVAGGGHNDPMPPGNISTSAEYNGASWTVGNSMSQARAIFGCSGTQTAALFTGGRSSPGVEDPTNKTEEYNGASFTSGGNYITDVRANTGQGGPQTSAYLAGGDIPPNTANTGTYDGTAWATAPALPAVTAYNAASSNNADNTTGLTFGGGSAPTYTATYEFTAGTTAANYKTITTS